MIRTIADIKTAIDEGRTWYGMYRRAGPAMAVGIFSDLSYAAGIPVANYYASTPLVSAVLDNGIDIGPPPAAGLSKYLYRVTMLPSTAVGIAAWEALDLCLYYPFVDGDGGLQEMINTVPIPRHDGLGCRIMVVSQGVGVATVNAIVTYTNSDGVSGRQVTVTLNLAAPAGQLCSSFAGSAQYPMGAYLPLCPGCKGVRSIQTIEYLGGGGGIAAFVIVKPLANFGMFEATVAPVEVDFSADRSMKLPILPDGTILHLIARGTTAASPLFTGAFQTIWG